MGAPTMPSKVAAEALGTFLLVFTVGCNVLSGNAVWGGVSIACVLMVSIYALGGISGANFNPAVSLALGITKQLQGENGQGLDWKDVGIYMGTQVCAGIAAAMCYLGLFGKAFAVGPAVGSGLLQASVCEVFYTFMLCFVVLNVAATRATAGNQYYGLAIGFVIVAGAYGAGAVSGGCFNPAVALGLEAAGLVGGAPSAMGYGLAAIVYTLCEFIGAALAAVLFKMVRPGEFGAGEESKDAASALSEFLGTFMLVLTVGLNVLGNSQAGAFSIAASLMCMIYALGDVSGAHFNPAVTAAIVLSGRCPELSKPSAAKYVIVQVSAGILAGMTYGGIRGDTFALHPGQGFGWFAVALAEMTFTFVLCYVVLCVAVSKTTKSGTMFGLAIGSCVTVGGNAIGAISGGCLNPAVAFGIALSHFGAGSIMAAFVYTACELVGAGAAAGVFAVTHAVDVASDVKKDDGGEEALSA